MKTTSYDSELLGQAVRNNILGAFFLIGVGLLAIGCSDAAQTVPTSDCTTIASRAATASPMIHVAIEAHVGASPDVHITGVGFQPGAAIAIGYFGLPSHTADGSTVDLDLPGRVAVNGDGSFSVTQLGVSDVNPCSDAEMATTVSVAVSAGNDRIGTTAPAAFWCVGGRTSAYGSCE